MKKLKHIKLFENYGEFDPKVFNFEAAIEGFMQCTFGGLSRYFRSNKDDKDLKNLTDALKVTNKIGDLGKILAEFENDEFDTFNEVFDQMSKEEFKRSDYYMRINNF